MSDFDREAERERLREQFERDKAKREASERMSELLLKGATMTNKHCDNCGDPVFRHDGREFCPTCQTTAGQQAGQGADDRQATAEQQTTAEQRPRQGADGAAVDGAATDEGTADDAATDETDATAGAGDGATQEAGGRPAEQTQSGRGRSEPTRRPPERSRAADPRQSDGTAGESPVAGDVAEARASLTRSLAALARQAEATEDLSRKREYLAAAKEAAAALDAAERVDR